MKFRVLDLDTGNEIFLNEEKDFFAITQNGSLGILDKLSGDAKEVVSPHILEFAFRKDDTGEWIWEHSVIHEEI